MITVCAHLPLSSLKILNNFPQRCILKYRLYEGVLWFSMLSHKYYSYVLPLSGSVMTFILNVSK